MDTNSMQLLPDKQTLFEGQDIRLTKIEGQIPRAVVTFNHLKTNKKPDISTEFDEEGFGEKLFAKDGFAEYHIVSNKNDWFQSNEMETIMDILALELSAFKKIVFYGSSMGGYGAINFSYRLNAEFVALAPQYDICPNDIEGDTRWLYESKRVKLTNNYIKSGKCRHSRGWVFYDSFSNDDVHARKIAEITEAALIDVPYASHHVGEVINDVYGLVRIVEEVANEQFLATDFINCFETKKNVSDAYIIRKAFFLMNCGEISREEISNIQLYDSSLRNTGLCLIYLRLIIFGGGISIAVFVPCWMVNIRM